MSLNLNVERNGKTLELSKGVFGKKSPRKGQEFYHPVIEPPIVSVVELKDGSILDCLTNISGVVWFGISELIAVGNKYARSVYQEISTDNLDPETGLVNEEKMMADWANPFAGVERLKDIIAQMDIYVDEQQAILDSPDFGKTEDGTIKGVKTDAAVKAENRMLELAALIQPLRIAKTALEKEYAERVAKRKAREEAEEKSAKTEEVAK